MADRLICAYGPTGCGKTEAAIALAKWLYGRTGKLVRVAVCDGSLANWMDSGLVAAGIAKVCYFANMPWPQSVTNQLAEGYWPNETGEMVKLTPAEMTDTGFWVFEALSTMMRDYLMGNIKGGFAWRSGRGEKIGQDSPYELQDSEFTGVTEKGKAIYTAKTGTGEKFGGNPISHFNVAQTHAVGVLRRSSNLPGWVWWSSHEKYGEEKKKEGPGENAPTTVTGDKGIGPEVAGGALSMTIGRSFNDLLHFTKATKKVREQDATTGAGLYTADDEYRIYVRDHYDPDGIVQVPYKAVVRCMGLPPYVTAEKDAKHAIVKHAIVRLYEMVEERAKQNLAEAEALRARVAALKQAQVA